MLPSRRLLLPRCLAFFFLLIRALPMQGQQSLPMPPPPGKEAARSADQKLAVPMLDAPPTLTLPAPKKDKPAAQSPKGQEPAKKPASGLTAEPVTPPPLQPVAPTLRQNSDSSTSEIGQFKIHGADLESRNFINKLCEDTADQMSTLLRDSEHYEIPIVISIKTPPNVSPGPAVSTDVAQLAFGGFRLQITIQVRADFNLTDFREELVRMLLAERILRNHKELTTTRTRILPDWLLVGIKEAMRYRTRSRPSAIFAAVFRTGKVYGIEEILETTPGSLDALSRSIYETSCCALVMTLLEQPEGNLRMAKFLSSLATDSKSDRDLLNRWFPGLNASKSSLNKWWSLQMANLATPTIFETLGPSETAKELDQALMLHYEVPPSEVPSPHVATSDEEALKSEAESETKKRGFFGRMFASSTPEKPVDDPLAKLEEKPESKPEPAPPPVKKPRAQLKKDVASAPVEEEKPVVPQVGGFRLRNLFGFGKGSTSPDADSPKKEEKPNPEPKEEKPRPEPKKEEKPKPEPRKEEKPKPEPRKEEKPNKPEPKKSDKPKAEPKEEKKDDKPKAEEKDKRPSFFGRVFGGKPEDKSDGKKEEKPKDTDKKDEKPKPDTKKKKDEEKPSAALFDPSLLLRALADMTAPSFGLAFDLARMPRPEPSRYVFLGLGKKKDKTDDNADDPASKEDKKTESKKEKAESKKEEKPAPESKKEEKPKPKKERLVPVTIPLSDYSRIMKRSDARRIFAITANNLTALLTRAHPLFRPVIKQYADLVTDLGNHKTKDVDARLKELRVRRDQVLAQAKAVRDDLDVFEANDSSDYSGLFDDYLRLPKTIDQEIPRRADPISKALDEAEKQAH